MGAEAIFHASLYLFCTENEIYTGHGMASLPVVAARRRTSTSCGASHRCVVAHPSHYPLMILYKSIANLEQPHLPLTTFPPQAQQRAAGCRINFTFRCFADAVEEQQ